MFDIEELVHLLRCEGLKDICVIRVPESFAYADYLVLTTGRNLRHIKAAAYYVNWFVSILFPWYKFNVSVKPCLCYLQTYQCASGIICLFILV